MRSEEPHDGLLSLTGRRWRWPHTKFMSAPCPERPDLPGWITTLLGRRGIVGPAAIERYLSPSLAAIDDPATMADMDAALRLLGRAVQNRETIVVWGDYDVDGVCSTALLVEVLRSLGVEVHYYIPDRRGEGYGLNEAAVREVAPRARVLVTTDCGVTAHREIAVARELGCGVIVVDHHKVGDTLPPADACLDPHRPDCRFPYKGLCAAGVAFLLAVGLRRALRESGYFARRPEPDLRRVLDLVAIATVADMVPLSGLNRVFVTAGLRRIATSERLGLRALLEVSRVAASRVTSVDLAFRIGPRINARGRLSHAAEAVELLLTNDAQQARRLAAVLDAANRERREIERATVDRAVARVTEDSLAGDAALVAYDPSWHPGVLGLVASRLATRYQRPAVVIGEGGKGSARSIPGLDLHAAIAAASAHLVRFGGHAAAAGVTIEPAAVPAFRAALTAAVCEQLGDPPYVSFIEPDFEMPTTALSLDVLAPIERLAPFGQANPAPLWASAGVPVESARIVGGEHLKLTLEGGHEALGFGMGKLAASVPERLDLVYRLERDSYGGRDRLVLRLEDLRPTAASGG